MAIPNFMAQDLSIPPLADRLKNKSEFHGYTYKIGKFDLDDLMEVSEMEAVITRGMTTDEIVVVARDKFSFMDKYFAIVEWMEKSPE